MAAVLAACIVPALAADAWLTDIDAGRKQAAAENKAVLIEFTGSNWRQPCIKPRKNGIATSNTGTAGLAAEAKVKGAFAKDTYIHPDNSVARIGNSEVNRRHATMIRRINDSLADLIHLLKDLNIDNDTLIVFISDNGPHHESGSDPKHNHGAMHPAYFRAYGMIRHMGRQHQPSNT